MSVEESTELYDAYYYAHGCGRPYQRDRHWLEFFDRIAERIVADFNPTTVLDAGCAMGFLVEALRKRGVEAYGIDISDYAIDQVHQDIKPYCWVGSVTEPFPQRYDLIVSIEVLEHLEREPSEAAVANFCQHADTVLFSSSPDDFKETTHFNVQPAEYWAELFARAGLFRDVDYDAFFLTPWAVLFRKDEQPAHKRAAIFERRFARLWKENSDLRQSVTELRHELKVREERVERLRLETTRKTEQIGAYQRLLQKMNIPDQDLHFLPDTVAWKVFRLVRGLQYRILPPDSRQKVLLTRVRDNIYKLRTIGLREYLASRRKRRQMQKRAAEMSESDQFQAYQELIARTALSTAQLDGMAEAAKSLAQQPLISLITPVYDPPVDVLQAMIDSVKAQVYPHWELCLADGGSTTPEVRALLEQLGVSDERIKVQFLPENQGISGNSNAAAAMATGEFIQILDHDDVLAPQALFEIASLLSEQPDTDLIYFDEDKLSSDGSVRRDPFFKPDWSPELLISANYLTHSCLRRSLVQEIGGFDPAMDGAQDWDLVLRFSERTDKIAHVPKVLYHWRQLEVSAAGALDAKPWVFDRQIRCVENHLERRGIANAKAMFPKPGYLRAIWPSAAPKVSIIIPTKDKVDFLRTTITSLTRRTLYPNYEIIIVDNGSKEAETLAYYKSLSGSPNIQKVDFDQSFNYSAANNLGARVASGDILLFLNNDVEILHSDWLEEMVRWAELPEMGVVGAKLLYPDNTIQHAGVVVGMEGHASHVFYGVQEYTAGPFGSVDWYRNYSAITGACMMLRREVFEAIGGFDAGFVLAFSDVEICVRAIQQGYRVMYTPFARVRHFEGKSRGDHIPLHDIQVGVDRLLELVRRGDPYFNPNLSYTLRVPAIVRPDEEDRTARLERLVRRRTEAGQT
jgi:GT2 family glycosyltransferase